MHTTFGTIYSANAGMGIILCAFPNGLYHVNSSCSFPSSKVYSRRVSSTSLPDVVVFGVKNAWLWKSTLSTAAAPLPWASLRIELLLVFSECVIVHFKHRLTKQL